MAIHELVVRKPLENWEPNSFLFGQDCSYPTESGEMKHWGIHLGVDTNCEPGTHVFPIMEGTIQHIGYHPGTSRDNRNWGGLIILAHSISIDRREEIFYSLYGHLDIIRGKPGERIRDINDWIGVVGEPLSPDNGWWEDAHLHFAININPLGKWRGDILHGYAKDESPHRLADFVDPIKFFEDPYETIHQALLKERGWDRYDHLK